MRNLYNKRENVFVLLLSGPSISTYKRHEFSSNCKVSEYLAQLLLEPNVGA